MLPRGPHQSLNFKLKILFSKLEIKAGLKNQSLLLVFLYHEHDMKVKVMAIINHSTICGTLCNAQALRPGSQARKSPMIARSCLAFFSPSSLPISLASCPNLTMMMHPHNVNFDDGCLWWHLANKSPPFLSQLRLALS